MRNERKNNKSLFAGLMSVITFMGHMMTIVAICTLPAMAQKPIGSNPPEIVPAPPKAAALDAPVQLTETVVLQLRVLESDYKSISQLAGKVGMDLAPVDVKADVLAANSVVTAGSRGGLKQKVQVLRTDASLMKQFVDDIRAFGPQTVMYSEPRIQTIVGREARMVVNVSNAKATPKAITIHIQPTRVPSRRHLLLNTTMILPQSNPNSPLLKQVRLNLDSQLQCSPGKAAAVILRTGVNDRAYLVATELLKLYETDTNPQLAKEEWLSREAANRRVTSPTYYAGNPQDLSARSAVGQYRPKKPEYRVISLPIQYNTGVRKGDIVDLLLVYEDKDDQIKVEPVCENVRVYDVRPDGGGLSLIVEKKDVEKVLISQNKGPLELSIHRPTDAPENNTGYGAPVYHNPPGDNYSAGPMNRYGKRSITTKAQAQGFRVNPPSEVSGFAPAQPQPATPPIPAATNQISDVLREVRKMRELVQGLRSDISALRAAVGKTSTSQVVPKTGSSLLEALFTIKRGQSDVISLRDFVTRVTTSNPEVIEIQALSPNVLRILGKKSGEASATIHFDNNKSRVMKFVIVEPPMPVIAPVDEPLRREFEPAPTRRRPTLSPNYQSRANEALDRRIVINVDSESLESVLKKAHELARVNIHIDQRSIKAEGVNLNEPMSLHVENVPLRKVLSLILEPHSLAYIAEGEAIRIVGKSKADMQRVIISYSIKDLKSDKSNVDELVETITALIQPKSWSGAGGDGVIKPHRATNALVVIQSNEVHEQIQRLLSTLRIWIPSKTSSVRVSSDSKIELEPLVNEPARFTTERPIIDDPRGGNSFEVPREVPSPNVTKPPKPNAVQPAKTRTETKLAEPVDEDEFPIPTPAPTKPASPKPNKSSQSEPIPPASNSKPPLTETPKSNSLELDVGAANPFK